MARYVLLYIEDDVEADRFLLDCTRHDGEPVLTPVQENMVHAEIVGGLTDGDWRVAHDQGIAGTDQLAREVIDSHTRCIDLLVEYEAQP